MDEVDAFDDLMPSATPSSEEVREWQLLSREEQLRRLRLALDHPDSRTVTAESMDDIRAAAIARIEAKRRG
jgi:hypothetical protein